MLPAASVFLSSMKTGEDARGARSEGSQNLGLCVLCGLPAAGKSTFARALRHRLQLEQGWAVGVVAYDDVMPNVFLEEVTARPLVSTEGAGPRLRRGGCVPAPGSVDWRTPVRRGASLIQERPESEGKWSRFNTE